MEIIGKIAEGGQTWNHRVKMIQQVLKSAFIWAFLAGALTIGYLQYQEPKSSYQALYYWSKAKLSPSQKTIRIDSGIWKTLKQGAEQSVLFSAANIDDAFSSSDLFIHRYVVLRVCKKKVHSLLENFRTNLKKAGHFSIAAFALALLYFFFRGKSSRQKKHLSGIRLESMRKLKYRLIFSRRASDIQIGSLPLLKGSESQHIAILGSPNVGKTNCLRGLLRQLRKRGDRVIVLDIVGDFVSEFYLEGKDHLLNPYDTRSQKWHPWCECIEDYHYEQLAATQIPDHPRSENNYFYQAARSVLIAAMKKKKSEGNFKNTSLVHWLSTESMDQLAQDLSETSAAVYLDPKGERTTHSIRTTLINAMRGFEVLQDTDSPFSIRNWVLSPKTTDEWVFLSSTTEQRDQLKVLLSVWISVAINALKARDPSADNQKTWIIIDELHALQKLGPLAGGLAEVREYNGCLAIATQNFSQLDKLYGRDETSSMIDCCGTKVCFRQGDASIAKRMSELFGKREVREAQKGKSWGANTMGDRESKSEVEKEKYTVSPSWILSLPNRAAYIKLPGDLPAAKVRFAYLPLEKKVPSYLPRYETQSFLK